MMIMCDHPSRDAPEPWSAGWRRDHSQGYTPDADARSVR
jgi:hypothetical protein